MAHVLLSVCVCIVAVVQHYTKCSSVVSAVCWLLLHVRYILAVQVRDDVINGSALVERTEAAVDDVTSHVTMTSRRLSDVTDRAGNVTALVEQQLGDSRLQTDIAAVSIYSRRYVDLL